MKAPEGSFMFWKRPVPNKTPRCSFCRKAEDVAGVLISSPSNDSVSGDPIYICGECVAVCNSILEDRGPVSKMDKEEHSPAQDAAADSTPFDNDAPPHSS
jgi:hypothetical protein